MSEFNIVQSVQNRLGIRTDSRSDNFLGSEIISSLPLQMALFYNFYFSPIWFTATLTALISKHSALPDTYQFVTPTIFCIMTVCEAIRLYFGYLGNLQERVPELAAFWMVTLVLQLPLCLLSLLNTDANLLPLEVSVQVILLLFVVVELLISTSTIRHMTSVQETKFNLLHTPNREL
ncbi:transmembrane protein 17-like [Bolinopsis microptera]|uniref:transmembrane protein 17-like n=1 Tax=Bolinopsis microptera TaxID=2820187 RepID=UPI00307A121B